jgi:hypothetical protein
MRATATDRPLVSSAATPSRVGGLLFALKTRVLQLRRALRDLRGGPRRHRRDAGLPIAAAAVSESVTALWPESEETSPLLVAGKIHNLRVAARLLHGIEVPAGSTFSFWRQLGRAWCRRSAAACANCPMRSTTRHCARACRSSSGIGIRR